MYISKRIDLLFMLACCLWLPAAAAAQLPVRTDVPVLCYHNIFTDEAHRNNIYFISRNRLNEQLKALADSGYHTILPDQLTAYLTRGIALPPKPIMITFDDTRAAHFHIAAPLLQQYGFKAVFFIMTVAIGKPGYMSATEIKQLNTAGHVIGAHTWDHPYLNPGGKMDWIKQLRQPKQTLEQITGKPVEYFAYPFGEWNDVIIRELAAAGYKAAFQLSGSASPGKPLYTIRRIMPDGNWTGPVLQAQLKRVFARKAS
ncbi:polysaccharide deacetylase family protein [Chitinophaga rupis]|nr:polysaccharide deacetylase family protein [Chitinophaga rupis]